MRHIGAVASDWIMAPEKRRVADEGRISNYDWSSISFFIEGRFGLSYLPEKRFCNENIYQAQLQRRT